MNLKVTFSALVWATAVWAYVALAATADLHVAALLLFAAACPLALFRRRLGFAIPQVAWFLISLVVFAGMLFMWFRLAERMYAVVYLFLYLEANKLLTARTNRDHLQVIGLTLFQMLAVAVSTSSLLFVPILVGYLFLMIASLATFTIKRDAERAFRPAGAASPHAVAVRITESDLRTLDRLGARKFMGNRLFAGFCLATAAVVTMGVALFFSVPRLATRQFFAGAGTGTMLRKSGFSDSVDFGGVGEIQSDPTIIMRVEFDHTKGAMPYPFLRLRGSAMDFYTGAGWRGTSYGAERRNIAGDDIRQVSSPPSSWGPVRSGTITLEPLESGAIFLVNRPVSFNWSGRELVYREYVPDQTYSQLRAAHVPVRYRFLACPEASDSRVSGKSAGSTPGDDSPPPGLLLASERAWGSVVSAFGRLATISAGASGVPLDRQLARYRQLPDKSRDLDTVQAMAREWTGALVSPLDVAHEIERRLKNEFRYSLDISFSSQPDHLTRFLRDDRAGHCEYFATAMALMLRSRGIPTRVINGYLTDEWSAVGNGSYIVRQEHAHSWVEAYVDDTLQWVTFDPTPDGGVGSGRIPASFYRTWTRWMDALKVKWYESFVDYSGDSQQRQLASMLRLTALAFRGEAFSFRSLVSGATTGSRRSVGYVLLALGVAVVGYIGWALWGGRRRGRAAGDTMDAGAGSIRITEYLELLDVLEKLQRRPASQTPREYMDRVARERAELADAVPLTEAYYVARYHAGPWGQEERQRAAALKARVLEETARARP